MNRKNMELKICYAIIKSSDSGCSVSDRIKDRWPVIYNIVKSEGWDAVPTSYIHALYHWMIENDLI